MDKRKQLKMQNNQTIKAYKFQMKKKTIMKKWLLINKQ